MGFIYKIENQINHKIYIGLTKLARPTDRFSKHRYEGRHLKPNDLLCYIKLWLNMAQIISLLQ